MVFVVIIMLCLIVMVFVPMLVMVILIMAISFVMVFVVIIMLCLIVMNMWFKEGIFPEWKLHRSVDLKQFCDLRVTSQCVDCTLKPRR